MYALRTTILLGAFWLLVILLGVYRVHFRMRDAQEKLAAQEGQVRAELQTDEELIAGLATVQGELASLQNLWTYRSKAVPRRETAHQTYDYLDQILARQQTTMNFDFIADAVTDSNGVRRADYRLVGEAKFVDLYRFIWYLEHLPRYIRINSLRWQQAEVDQGDQNAPVKKRWVHFEMELTALSSDRQGFDAVQYTSAEAAPPEVYDPFEPPAKILAAVPANVLDLPNVFESTLRAMTPTQIYLTDQSGDLKVLGLGDEVYLGRLVDILPDDNRAVFELDQLSPPRQVSLQINEKK